MRTILDTGSTWFLESFSQGPYGSLVIRLAEGSISTDTEILNVAGVELGPARAVKPSQDRRVVEVVFKEALAFFTKTESFDSIDPSLEFEEHQGYIRLVQSSSLQEFARKATGIYNTWVEGICEYHLWTEDQIFQVFSNEPPEVVVLAELPDASIERGGTWYRGNAS
jgi:hypothetical protein